MSRKVVSFQSFYSTDATVEQLAAKNGALEAQNQALEAANRGLVRQVEVMEDALLRLVMERCRSATVLVSPGESAAAEAFLLLIDAGRLEPVEVEGTRESLFRQVTRREVGQ